MPSGHTGKLMSKDNSGERLTIRTSNRLNNQIEEIMDVRDLRYSSDAIREAADFYHRFLTGGNGMGIATILHLPSGILDRADALVGYTANDMENVLIQAMNIGLHTMLKDAENQKISADRIRRTKARLQTSRGTPLTV